MRAGDWEMDAGMLDALGLEEEAPHGRVPTEIEGALHASARPRHRDANYAANAEGARRVIEAAEAEMTEAERAAVDRATLAGQTQEEFDALPERERLIRRAEAISQVVPRLALGDPAELWTGARSGTDDAAHISVTVTAALGVLSSITSGAHDAGLAQVFGAASVDIAKANYGLAAAALQRIHAAGGIVTDRSGTLEVLSAGGLSRGSETILMEARFIDEPSNLATVGFIHEAMHAGNPQIRDRGSYVDSPMFTGIAETAKLLNAAHYEVVPRRILSVEHAHEGVTFNPAAVSTPTEGGSPQAIRAASERLNDAWTMALNLHVRFMDVYQQPTLWWRPQGAGSYRDGMPYWSKVEKLTIHEKAEIRPMSSDPALLPVSQIDLALSEAVTSRIARCKDLLDGTADSATEIARLEALATTAERTAAQSSVEEQRDLWIKIALRAAGAITGTEARDLRVIQRLVELQSNFASAWQHRDPSSFAD